MDKGEYRNPYQWVDLAINLGTDALWKKDVFFASYVLRLNDGTRHMVAMPGQNSLQNHLRLGYFFRLDWISDVFLVRLYSIP